MLNNLIVELSNCLIDILYVLLVLTVDCNSSCDQTVKSSMFPSEVKVLFVFVEY